MGIAIADLDVTRIKPTGNEVYVVQVQKSPDDLTPMQKRTIQKNITKSWNKVWQQSQLDPPGLMVTFVDITIVAMEAPE
jgi:hypothetical protein